MTVKPFQINVQQPILDDLQERLRSTRWPDEVTDWSQGTSSVYMRALAHYWQHEYDWRKQEATLNEFAHFKTEIDGVGIHFIHERGKGPNPTPILLLHGWPDSFYRFYKIIPMLTEPARFGGNASASFDVIVPSLPGFGFSDKPPQRAGVDTVGILVKLMTEVLGFEQFGVQGGDTGSPLAMEMAKRYPQAVVGIHLTDIGYDATFGLDPATLSPDEETYVAQVEQWSYAEGAYFMIQSTKPQTLAYGLTDSPVGMAAWILNHFYSWSESEQSFTKDELLTNVMIYWVTETFNSSIRWYFEEVNAEWNDGDSEAGSRPETPVAVALFPKDIPPDATPPRELAERRLNVQRWTKMPRGGHFSALEEPELLAEDIRTFFSQLR